MPGLLVDSLILPMSQERLETYRPHPSSNDDEMVATYFWNIALCESLYAPLHALEVSLRNSIHNAFTERFGSDSWYDDPRCLEPGQMQTVVEVERRIARSKGEDGVIPGRVIAGLSFGFWTRLFSRPYVARIWEPDSWMLLVNVFPHAPNRLRNRSSILARLERARILRNRVFHFEPVWNRVELLEEYQQILDSIGWISPELREIVALMSQFPSVHSARTRDIQSKFNERFSVKQETTSGDQLTTLSERIATVGERILADLEGVNAARERALAESRQIVRLSANTIRAVHRHDFDEAEGLLSEARRMNDGLAELLADYPQIYWAGYMRDAQKEFAEASTVLAIVAGRDLPGPGDIGVENSVYLNGLGEAAGEMRRYALDAMRRWDLDRAENVLAVMDDIYSLLVTVDYPDAVTGGLRRTTDMVRGVLERTRGDLTVALQQRALTQALDRVEAKLDGLDK